jgi:DNA modification methylase
MNIERIAIEALSNDPANVRKHSTRNIDAIVGSLRKFGQQKPIVVNGDNVVVAGNGTLEAAKKLGWKEINIVRTELKGSQATAFAIADNRTAELAEWDTDALAGTLAALQTEDEELARLTGFDDSEMQKLIDESCGVEVVEDDPPEPPVNPITKPGDLWKLGRHRVLCGDSTKVEDVERLMGGAKAICVVTDPPYGVSIGAKNRFLNSVQPSGRCLENIESDDMKPEELKAMLLPAFTTLRTHIMAEDCTLFVTAPQRGELSLVIMLLMQEAGLPTRHVLIWKKNQPTFSMGRLDYDYAHEPILLTWGKRHKRPMNGTHKTSVWEIDRERKCDAHPTMKPVALYANAYQNNSDSGDVVADIYCGSGTAIVAAEQLNRTCYGMEISPAYCDVIVARWEKLTGGKAERISSTEPARAV